jgi:hypothetical protein
MTVGDAAAGKIVRREGEGHTVALQNPDLELRHLAGAIGKDLVAVLELHPIHPVREHLGDEPLYFDSFFLCHRHLLFEQKKKPAILVCG